MHSSTFGYLKPSEAQVKAMAIVRLASASYASVLEAYLPEGPDKTYIMRKLREVAMWSNTTITRHADGTPREPQELAMASSEDDVEVDNGGLFHGLKLKIDNGLKRNSLDQRVPPAEKGSKGPGPEMVAGGVKYSHD